MRQKKPKLNHMPNIAVSAADIKPQNMGPMICPCQQKMKNPPGMLPMMIRDADGPLIVGLICTFCSNGVPITNGRPQTKPNNEAPALSPADKAEQALKKAVDSVAARKGLKH